MQFIVQPEIFKRFPNIRLAVAVAHGIDNQAESPEIAARWQEVWAETGKAAAISGNAQSHPRVKPWRERFQAQGVSGKQFPSSIEAMLRRALRSNAPFSINPLVDFYNTVSLQYIVPAGGFDLAQLHGPLELRLTRSGDMFIALDEDVPQGVSVGEVAYADGNTILTRHFVWRQSKIGLITQATQSVFLVSEILGELGSVVAAQVLAALSNGLEQYFGVTPTTFLVDEQQPTILW
jgi:DNA/RNA-binding domain of Phe-tRNA-synthetase-like protein